jgi:FAD/FMN-containing dehydrogenase
VRRDELRNSIDAEGWSRWTRTFLALLDEGPTVATSPEDSTIKRLRLAEIAVRARRLLDEAGLQPTLPGAYGRAVKALRSPTDSDAVAVSDAIERLARLAALLEAGPPRVSRTRFIAGQISLPGFEPNQPTNPGVPR